MPGCAIVSATSSSATMPAKALRTPAISRMEGMKGPNCGEAMDERSGEAAQGARCVECQQDQDGAEHDEPQLVGDPQRLGQRDEQDRANQRPEQIAGAAE